MSEGPLIGVLALQGDFREHLAALRACEVEGVPVRLVEDLERVDALIIPGGESTTMSRLMAPGLHDRIRGRVRDEGMPLMGTCAGMILMATAVQDGHPEQKTLGLMDITVRRNAYGRQVDSFEASVESPLGPTPAVFIRAPQVVEQGKGVQTLSSHNGRAVAVRQDLRLALAFHPELTPDLRWHQYFLDLGSKAAS